MDELNKAAQHRNQLEAYLTAIFSPHLIASPLKDSTVVKTGYLAQSRPSNDYWGINKN
uniref:Uncharacterized protein n=1 Tax=viral metagenome TaxID=1070528 RepID=A0A6M3Y2K2_9ZZZZ